MKENESANSVVSVRSLVKRYGDILALDHFNLEIGKGEIFGLLGPNGCGKTTAINCMLQLLAYDKGDIELFGEAMKPTRYDLKRRIGVVPQQVAVFDELTVFENIDCFCALYVSWWKRPSNSWDLRITAKCAPRNCRAACFAG